METKKIYPVISPPGYKPPSSFPCFLNFKYSRRTLHIEGIPDYKMPSADEVLEDDVKFESDDSANDVNDDDGDEFEAESQITQYTKMTSN